MSTSTLTDPIQDSPQNYVRYSDDVEQMQPEEEEVVQCENSN